MNAPVLALCDAPPTLDELRDHAVTAVARSEAAHADAVDARSLWRNLVEGRCRVLERFERNGRRYYVVRENLDERRSAPPLDPREQRLAEILGWGESEKAAAYALGLTPSAVSALLRTTLGKLGLASRIELVLLLRSMRVETAA